MNYIKKTIFFVFILLLNVSCGRDGTDGDIYLRIRSVLEPTNVKIVNPDIPSDGDGYFVGAYDVYYQIQPGSYDFSYVDHNGTQHPLPGEFGFIEVVSDPGQTGSLFKSGEDGKDLYIDLILLSTGPIIENFEYYTIASSLEYFDE